MKKLFVCIIACLPAVAFAQAGQFTIKGSLGNYNAPAKVYLQYHVKDTDITDSVTLVNGKFILTGETDADHPVAAFMAFNPKGDGINNIDSKSIFLEKGLITITGTDKLKTSVAGGTRPNVDNEKLNAEMAGVNRALEKWLEKTKNETAQQKQSVEFQDEMNKEMADIGQQQLVIEKKFIAENPDSFVSLSTLNYYAYVADYTDIQTLYNNLSPRLKQTTMGQQLAARLPHIKAVAINAIAPDFAEPDTSGNLVNLSSFRGKFVLIDFWASWCTPCRAENPNILKAFNQYKDKNFTVLGVSLDGPDQKKDWIAAIQKDGVPWTQVSDLNSWYGKAAQLYLINGIPQNVLLDPDGKIIAKNLRGNELEIKLEQIFNKTE